MKLITVVIPVSSAHIKYLPEAIASVKEQSVDIADIVVVNDTGQPIKPGVPVIRTPGRKGAAVARNLALREINTPFTVFLDADDILIGNALETMVRAYADYGDASYIYGDSWSRDKGKDTYYVAANYDRNLIFQHNLHNITALLPTEIVKAVGGFDEVIRGWEDWDFYIRLAIGGYCGTKIPTPLIIYRLDTGANRAYSATIANDLIRDVRERYADYISGEVAFMGCCGGNPQLGKTIQNVLGGPGNGSSGSIPNGAQVMVEFIGEQTGSIPFRMSDGTIVRGANTPQERFQRVRGDYAVALVESGFFRLVPIAPVQARRQPELPAANQVTRPNFKEASGSAVTTPQLCVRCQHIEMFHGERGCQALTGNKACGCDEFKLVLEEKPKPKRKRKVTA